LKNEPSENGAPSHVMAVKFRGGVPLKLDGQSVASWAYELMANRHFLEAIEIMKLDVQLDPSIGAYVGLAEAYRQSGQKQLAVDSYRRALKADPSNIFVKEILGKLEADGRW
jgi:tetratricopeptide (TPR) repeat protein